MDKEMGKTWCTAFIENWGDIHLRKHGIRDDVRSMTVECLADTGASKIFLPQSLVDRLGLEPDVKRVTKTAAGEVERWVYDPVQITILGRSTKMEVIAIPDETGTPPIIGYLILEDLHLMVNANAAKLEPTPETRDHYFIDMF